MKTQFALGLMLLGVAARAASAFAAQLGLPIVLKDGRYLVHDQPAWCPQAITATVENGIMKSVLVNYELPCDSSPVVYRCAGEVCTGEDSWDNQIQVLSSKSYRFTEALTGTSGEYVLAGRL
jgi:hypothetical protein